MGQVILKKLLKIQMIQPTYPDIVDPQEGHSIGQIAIESLDSDSQIKVINLSEKEVD